MLGARIYAAGLFAVQLDDQMLFNIQVDVLTVRELDDASGHIGLVAVEPLGNGTGAKRFHHALELVAL